MFYKKKIFVDGGSQIRPNVNIKDLVRAVDHFIFTKKTFKHNVYKLTGSNEAPVE